MALIGNKIVQMCTFTESESNGVVTESLGTGFVIGKPVKTSLAVNFSEAELYAGDGLAESAKDFTDGTITHELDDISDDDYAKIYGATKDAQTSEITDGAEDTRPFIREGWISARIKNNAKSYRVVVLQKVQFTPDAEEYESSGKNTSFKTATAKGTVMRDKDGNWRKRKTFTSLSDAQSYLNTATNVSTT